jgi:GntR family transcriptional regulator
MAATPDYVRIADSITAQVRRGSLKPGDKLPSLDDMVREYDTSSSTLRLVFVRLEALKVVNRRQGKGIFVTDPKIWMRDPEA